MSHWNHRILAFHHKNETTFIVKEVYYNDDEHPDGYGDVSLSGENFEEMFQTLEQIKKAMGQPVLWGDEDKFPKEYDGEAEFNRISSAE